MMATRRELLLKLAAKVSNNQRATAAIATGLAARNGLIQRSSRSFSTAAQVDPPTATIVNKAAPADLASSLDQAKLEGETPKRSRVSDVTIQEVLKAKHTARWVEPVIPHNATVRDAIVTCISQNISGMMVVDRTDTMKRQQKCVGLITSRDLLRIMAASIKDGKSAEEILNQSVIQQMTPINQVIYGRPDETIGMCRAIMAKLGIKCLPILVDGRVEGIITARDMSEFYYDPKDLGGKKNYLTDVSERVGLSENTSMAEPPIFVRQHLASKHDPLFINVGTAEYPHPFKSHDGVGANRRDFGPDDLATDPSLSEDAHFVSTVEMLDESGTNMQKLLYMGVADGVGSWREYGVDPRDFSRMLMGECQNILRDASSECSATGGTACTMISPAELLARSYKRTKEANVIGSSTACVGVFDSVHHQLHFSNIGDSGIIVLRHIDSDVASALQRNRTTPRTERKSDLRIAFVSQQQLKSFNHPYQMGWTGEEVVDKNSSFKQASDSCTSSVHILRGDIIIMATDGLFDNVDIDDIASIALKWELDNEFIDNGGIDTRRRRWESGSSLTDISAQCIPTLAEMLCQKARENSLDNTVDSPFALLAKENDIMWSGGMPDDCTVVAMHVVGKPANLNDV
ncbi:protein-serine/threonine phosphatase, PP2C family [Skeletonema marinoi]|uniref:Protein phosphatase n=1 Tax=Skeletonema marinoi TaxID=267567 RepID=A0AAD9D5S5_9STRA|nr:protein-serine/threonine phosphatase, PP2C family [Skeletonema marinoi]|mmetsp:Transcript_25335/g.43029  ORF Transcript_25335/g.43029 Transcript_25335/m.43029 type:complete len:631 (-) Transcript_25335:766-2658(-)